MLCAKNWQKNLHKHPGPTFQLRPGPGCFSRADLSSHDLHENRFASKKELDVTATNVYANLKTLAEISAT